MASYTTNGHATNVEVNQASKEQTLNETNSIHDAMIAGYITKSVAGNSNVTLTASEARARVIELTGALTGNISVDLPSVATVGSARVILVHNNTSGAFTVNFRYNGGTGVKIPQGYAQEVYHNGVNVYAIGNAFAPATNVTTGTYAEGTWTPAITLGGGNTGITYGAQTGTYTRIGDRVFIECRITLTSKGSSTGGVLVTGLPVTIGPSGARAVGAVYANNASYTGTVVALAEENTTTLSLRVINGGSASQLTDAQINNTFDVFLSLAYRTN